MPKRKIAIEVIVLGVLVLLGLYIRMNGLWEYYYSPDDILRILISSGDSLRDVVIRNETDTHPLLIYIVLHYMLKISENELFLRGISLIPGILFILSSYYLGKVWKSTLTGFSMAILTAFSYGTVIQSVILRQYMPALFFLSLALISLFHFLKNLKNKYLYLYFIFSFISVSFHYLMIIPIIGSAIFFVQVNNLSLKVKVITLIKGFLPLLLFVLLSYFYHGKSQWLHGAQQQDAVSQVWLTYGYPSNLREYFFAFILLLYYFVPPKLVFLVIYFALFVFSFIVSIKQERKNLILFVVFCYSVSIFLTSMELYPFTGSRHALHLYIPTILLISYGFEYLYVNFFKYIFVSKVVRFSVLIITSSIFFAPLITTNYYKSSDRSNMDLPTRRSDYTKTIDFITNKTSEGDIIIADNQAGFYLLHAANTSFNEVFSNKINHFNFKGREVYYLNHWGFYQTKENFTEVVNHIPREHLSNAKSIFVTSIGWVGMGWNIGISDSLNKHSISYDLGPEILLKELKKENLSKVLAN